MNIEMETAAIAATVGIGGTVALDAWALLLQRAFDTPPTNWAMVGRWLGYMRHWRFTHESIATANPVGGERALGWAFHYGIGAAYGLLLLVLSGEEWFRHPEALTPVLLSLALLVAPYFVMMPGLGLGIAGARTPKPYVTRLKSVAGHTAFGLGMYATALVLKGWASPLASLGMNGILQ